MSLSALAIIPLLAYALVFMTPSVTHTLQSVSSPAAVFKSSFLSSIAVAALSSFLISSSWPHPSELIAAGLMYYGTMLPHARLLYVYSGHT
jgi:hypothetical protein